jgi:hypothetical protein
VKLDVQRRQRRSLVALIVLQSKLNGNKVEMSQGSDACACVETE